MVAWQVVSLTFNPTLEHLGLESKLFIFDAQRGATVTFQLLLI